MSLVPEVLALELHDAKTILRDLERLRQLLLIARLDARLVRSFARPNDVTHVMVSEQTIETAGQTLGRNGRTCAHRAERMAWLRLRGAGQLVVTHDEVQA